MPRCGGPTWPPIVTTSPGATRRPGPRGSTRSRPARRARGACRTGSSACTRWSRMSSRCPGSTRWGGRGLRRRAPGGRRAPVSVPGTGEGPVRSGTAVRAAAIDCGTNSLRLLVADVDPAAGTLADVDRRLELVRLGQGVDAAGRLAPDALARTLRVLRSYAGIIEAASASAVRMVATSATRDAANAGEFVAGVLGVLGVEPEVLSGEEEARLSFTGATAELAGRVAAPCLVTDIGG